MSDSVSNIVADHVRNISETATLTAQFSKTFYVTDYVYETLSLTDTPDTNKTWLIDYEGDGAFSESVSFSIEILAAEHKFLYETVTFDDDILKRDTIKLTSESLTLTGQLGRNFHVTDYVSESLAITDSAQRNKTWLIDYEGDGAFSESVSFSIEVDAVLNKQLSETLSLTDSFSEVSNINVRPSETILLNTGIIEGTLLDTENDDVNGFDQLNAIYDVRTFTIGDNTYAILSNTNYDSGGGVEIANISDPTNIIALDSATGGSSDGNGGTFDRLYRPNEIDVFYIDGNPYAIATSATGNYPGIQIINLSDPSNILASDSVADTDSTSLRITRSVDIFQTSGSSNTYAIVADSSGSSDAGVQIIDVTNPTNVVVKDSMSYGDGIDELYNAYAVRTYSQGTSTYAIVAGYLADGIRILDISNVNNIVAKDNANNGVGGFDALDGPLYLEPFSINGKTYVIITEYWGDGIQIADITDPDNIIPTDSEHDNTNGWDKLQDVNRIELISRNGVQYAFVTGPEGKTLIDLSNPKDIRQVSHSLPSVTPNHMRTFSIGSDNYYIGYGGSTFYTVRFDDTEIDTVSINSNIHRRLSDSIDLTDSASRTKHIPVSLDESVSLSAEIDAQLIKQLSETLSLSHSIVKHTEKSSLDEKIGRAHV